ncbi:MAG: hypothetical protein SO189_03070 [Erysipelotrichaceae bacterium]|nr:hypothetical protein [Solobacterium sp.]MDY3793906.1 hypothetical protein [Erysipelotrichaceae bacterium]
MAVSLCYIKEKYFIDNSFFVKMLDPGNYDKQSKRSYLSLRVDVNSNSFYIPLRNNLKNDIKPFGRVGHLVPSKSRPNAGFDFRYALIVNDSSYIERPTTQRIPTSQFKRINNDIDDIEKEFNEYIKGFIKAMRKSRIQNEPLYRESSLINFVDILQENVK